MNTLGDLLGVELHELHDAMDKLGWSYVKNDVEETTGDIRCCGSPVMLRGIVGVDTAQCLKCKKVLQNMAGLVPLKEVMSGYIEPDLYENDGRVWLPINADADISEHKRVAELEIWTEKLTLPM